MPNTTVHGCAFKRVDLLVPQEWRCREALSLKCLAGSGCGCPFRYPSNATGAAQVAAEGRGPYSPEIKSCGNQPAAKVAAGALCRIGQRKPAGLKRRYQLTMPLILGNNLSSSERDVPMAAYYLFYLFYGTARHGRARLLELLKGYGVCKFNKNRYR